MTSTKSQPDYAALVIEAEKAVAAVVDPELKQAAFVKVLDTLLASASERSSDDTDVPPAATKGKAAKGAKRSVPGRGGTVEYIKELVGEGFFKTQRTIGAVKTELGNRGHHIPLTNLSGPLQRMCQQRVLRREKKTHGKKTVFAYSKW